MFRRSNVRWPACLLFVGLLIGAESWGAEPTAVLDRAVDMVMLVDGKQLLGMFAQLPEKDSSGDTTITFYVAREWLRKHQPDYYRKYSAGEAAQRQAALEQYRERLQAWCERKREPKLLRNVIERGLRDVELQLQKQNDRDERDAAQLVILELPAKQVKRYDAKPQDVRRLLALAWEARLQDAEQLRAADLAERLKQQDIDVEHREPDLSDRFALVPLTARQWSAQVGLIEFEILGKPHFQGTGGTLVEADGAANQPPLADLLGGLLQDQLGDALGDLFNPQPGANQAPQKSKQQAAIDRALASAADAKATGARVTYLAQDLAHRRVTVTDAFYALMPDGAWQSIWQQSQTATADGTEAQDAEALAADPQVAEIMQTIKGLGLDANQDILKSALRFGAATQKAMRETERAFAAYVRCHTRRLMGPPVVVPEPKAQP